jgi:signal transduction histidine kinase
MPSTSNVPHRIAIGRGLLAWKLPLVSLEWKLPLIMIAVFAGGLAALLGFTYATLAGRAESIVRDRLVHAAGELARGAGQSLSQHAIEMQAAAKDSAVRRVLLEARAGGISDGDRAAAVARLQSLFARADSLPVELRDESGKLLIAAGRDLGDETRPPVPAANTATDSVHYTGMRTVRADSTTRFWSIVPVRVGPEIRGWIFHARRVSGAPDAPRMLSEIMREDVKLYLRDENGGAWTTAPGRSVAPPLRRWTTSSGLTSERAGIGVTVGEEVQVPGTSWYMVLESPLAWIRARPQPTVLKLAMVCLALVVVGAVLSWLLSRQITRPLKALTEAAERVARGEGDESPKTPRGDEIARLAVAFDEMSRRVGTAQRELEQRAADAESGNRAKSAFLATMSHELRTPLNAISGYAELLDLGIYGPVNDAQREALRRIGRSQEHLLSLIDNVLSFARIDAGRLNYSIDEVPLATVLADVDTIITPQTRVRQLNYQLHQCGPDVVVRADPDKLRQVLLNLLGNAIKYNQDAGLVSLTCEVGPEEVHVHVTDTGRGIPPDRLEHVFEPFVQGSRDFNRPDQGVGLGLAISRELTCGMGADLLVQSEVGVGSTFTVVLPRSIPVAALDGPRAYVPERVGG